MERWISQSELASLTGMVIPAYFSTKPPDDMVRDLLWMTLSDCGYYLPLEQIWVVVDGDDRTERLVAGARERLDAEQGSTFNTLLLAQNRGKLAAINEGTAALLQLSPSVEYVVIRDSDGDHAVSEVPDLVRMALILADLKENPRVIVIGSRRNRHRPMGWLRGELEPLLDKVTLDALAYALARRGRALDLTNCVGAGIVPDVSSGFKVYSRELADQLFLREEPHLACLSADNYWHYGPETATFIEAMLGGAVFGEKLRITWDGQPASSFGEFTSVSLYGELLAWVFARLEIPTDVAAQFYDNHVPSMQLRTTTEGRGLLMQVRRFALDRLCAYRREAGPPPQAQPLLPFL